MPEIIEYMTDDGQIVERLDTWFTSTCLFENGPHISPEFIKAMLFSDWHNLMPPKPDKPMTATEISLKRQQQPQRHWYASWGA